MLFQTIIIVHCESHTKRMYKPRGKDAIFYCYNGLHTITTYLLTYSMMQSPSWEANWFAASQKIPRILCNPKVHHRTHKRPPPVPILCQPNPVHIPISHLLEVHPNIFHPSTPRSPQWSLSLRFPHQDPIRPPLLTHTRHMFSKLQCTKIQMTCPLITAFYTSRWSSMFFKFSYLLMTWA